MNRNIALALAAGCACTASAMADLTLQLVATQDVAILCDSVNTPNYYIGNNPSVISLVGSNLFVGGYKNNTATTGVAARVAVTKIENIFGTRAFRAIPTSVIANAPAFRGYYGCQYDYGSAQAGLVINYDSASIGTEGAFRLYDVDTQLSPILKTTSPLGLSARGGAGAAFDYGHDGAGFDYGTMGIGTGVHPLLAVLDFSDYGGTQVKGPFGVAVTGDYALDVLQGQFYSGDSVDGSGNATAPIINGTGSNGVTISGTLWRDITIDPRNGNLAARASNDVVIARRNANNGVASKVVISCPAASSCDNIPFQILQRCELLWGSTAGDLVVYNKYGTGAGNLTGFVKAADLDGVEVPVTFQNADGTPFSAPGTGGIYDFSWDAPNGKLAISDFAARKVYIFEIPAANTCPPCAADFNQDGGVDGGDIEAFFSAWQAGDSCGDTNQDGGVDGADIESFFSVWSAGGC